MHALSSDLAIGLNLPTWPLQGGAYATWPEMREIARAAEAMGVDTLWVADHLLRELPGSGPIGFWECWTILSAAAEATTRIGIGSLVACTGFRNPGLLAKMAATLDEVSGGRLVLGLGSGVPATDASWQAFGFDADRHVGRHEESVEVVARLLREPEVSFAGAHIHLDHARIVPAGPRADGPPVWVAAKGERTARIAARWADAINVNALLVSAADAEGVVATARAACDAVGRDPATLPVTGIARLAIGDDGVAVARDATWLSGEPAEVAAALRAIHGTGVTHVTLYVGHPSDRSPYPALTMDRLDRFAPFLAALRHA